MVTKYIANARAALLALLAAVCAAHAPQLLAQTARAVPGGYDPCANPNAYKLPECQRPVVAPPRPLLQGNNPAGMPTGAAAGKAAQLWQQGNALFDRRDYRRAMTIYQEGAALGDPRAMAVIGNMYIGTRTGSSHRRRPSSTIPTSCATM